MAKKQIHLGLSIRYLGYHVGAWRHPDATSDGASQFREYLAVAKEAERAKFDMLFIADGVGVRSNDTPKGSLARASHNVELEPLTLLSALAPLTEKIGLIATASTTYNEPYHIARKFGSLDQISGGRSGWNIVTSWSDNEAKNFNSSKTLDYDTRYERAEEFVKVVTGLWNSWDRDAFVLNKESGIFYDESKMHVLNHVGKHFSVRGPLTVRRSPQGRPILVQSGTNPTGQNIAAQNCDVIFAAFKDIVQAKAYYESVKGRMDGYGRQRNQLHVLPGFTPIVGNSRAEAQEKYEALNTLIDPMVALSELYRRVDISHLPVDGPFPEPNEDETKIRSSTYLFWKLAKDEGLTILELAKRLGMSQEHNTVVGTAEDVADVMEEWIDGNAADGFNITPTHLPGGLTDFTTKVIPILQKRGRYRTEYAGTTLRENLGLENKL